MVNFIIYLLCAVIIVVGSHALTYFALKSQGFQLLFVPKVGTTLFMKAEDVPTDKVLVTTTTHAPLGGELARVCKFVPLLNLSASSIAETLAKKNDKELRMILQSRFPDIHNVSSFNNSLVMLLSAIYKARETRNMGNIEKAIEGTTSYVDFIFNYYSNYTSKRLEPTASEVVKLNDSVAFILQKYRKSLSATEFSDLITNIYRPWNAKTST